MPVDAEINGLSCHLFLDRVPTGPDCFFISGFAFSDCLFATSAALSTFGTSVRGWLVPTTSASSRQCIALKVEGQGLTEHMCHRVLKVEVTGLDAVLLNIFEVMVIEMNRPVNIRSCRPGLSPIFTLTGNLALCHSCPWFSNLAFILTFEQP